MENTTLVRLPSLHKDGGMIPRLGHIRIRHAQREPQFVDGVIVCRHDEYSRIEPGNERIKGTVRDIANDEVLGVIEDNFLDRIE